MWEEAAVKGNEEAEAKATEGCWWCWWDVFSSSDDALHDNQLVRQIQFAFGLLIIFSKNAFENNS